MGSHVQPPFLQALRNSNGILQQLPWSTSLEYDAVYPHLADDPQNHNHKLIADDYSSKEAVEEKRGGPLRHGVPTTQRGAACFGDDGGWRGYVMLFQSRECVREYKVVRAQ